MSLNNYKSVLVTGGTGSFGKQFVRTVLAKFPNIERLVVFSRDELKQYDMTLILVLKNTPQSGIFWGTFVNRIG